MDPMKKILAVQKMQDYIKEHSHEEIKLADVIKASGYSQRHAIRVFKELLGKTPLEYIKAIRLTQSARELLQDKENILEIAMNTQFETHEGFTRAFTNEFGITPQQYRKEKPPVKYFVQYPVKHSHFNRCDKEELPMESKEKTFYCTVSIVERPQRKLMLMRAKKAHDYWSFCQEKGCDWEGLFNSIECRLENAAIIEMPEKMVIEGTTSCAAGVEIPAEYAGKIPEGCDLVELPPCLMLYFQSGPYENEDDYAKAINNLNRAIKNYHPEGYGYEYAFEAAPRYNFGATTVMGAKQAYPVRKIS